MPKQKKQQSKLKRTLGWFKPTSPAKGALLFAIAFVVIGGGYMTYQAFAWAETSYGVSDIWYSHGTANTIVDRHANDGTKNYTTYAWRLAGEWDRPLKRNAVGATMYIPDENAFRTYKVCVRGRVPLDDSISVNYAWTRLNVWEFVGDTSNRLVADHNVRYWKGKAYNKQNCASFGVGPRSHLITAYIDNGWNNRTNEVSPNPLYVTDFTIQRTR